MNTGLIITMGFVAIGTAVTEKVCDALGKGDMSQWVRLGGTSLVGASAVGLAISLLNQVKKAFGG
jgi:hypothetical protein